jgi:hypothetical protein
LLEHGYSCRCQRGFQGRVRNGRRGRREGRRKGEREGGREWWLVLKKPVEESPLKVKGGVQG